ncbi:prepilin-type N-terminal cleavage/methylation domain-containing protein [bacterium]|nr:prepilin-type N-terminal cleavage/methylation domain-containing protein [bacterium]
MQAKRGFTLAEVIIVVVIMAIIVSVTAPAFVGSLQKYQMNQAGSDLLMLLRYARQRAVVTQEPRRVGIDLDRGSYWIWDRDLVDRKDKYRARDDRRKWEKKHLNHVPEGYAIRAVYKTFSDDMYTNGIVEIFFYPDGTAEGARVALDRLATDKHPALRSGVKVENFNSNPRYMDADELNQTFGGV